MFNNIINPNNNESYSIHSIDGKNVIKNYINFIKYGGMINRSTETMEELETELKEINSKSEKHFTDVNNVKIENTEDAKNFELPKD